MANATDLHCSICFANLALVGRVHNCIPKNPAQDRMAAKASMNKHAQPLDARAAGTYQYRNTEARRAYMRDYMRKKRNAV
jgi:hypothetical protein